MLDVGLAWMLGWNGFCSQELIHDANCYHDQGNAKSGSPAQPSQWDTEDTEPRKHVSIHFHNAVLFLQSILFRATKCYILVLWIQFWYVRHFPTYKSILLNIWTLVVCFNFSWTLNMYWQKRSDWVKHIKSLKTNENNVFLNWHTSLRSLKEAIFLHFAQSASMPKLRDLQI